MVHLKERLVAVRGRGWSQHNKRIFWLLCTLLFWSSCRGGEMAMETESQFDPKNNLLWEDLEVGEGEESVMLTLKAPKEVKGLRNIKVEVFRVGGELCPMEALEKFKRKNKLGENKDLPVFRWDSGRNITLSKMNKLLKEFLGDRVDYKEGHLGIHCFRNAIPSLMKELGYDEEDIKAQGRWSSEAFKNYMKLNRRAKREERRRLAGDVNRAAGACRGRDSH